MGAKITHSRLKPKKESTFGMAKKPFKGKGKNRKGSKKESGGLGGEVFEHKRIKPKVSGKKGGIKKRVDDGYVPLNPNKPVRFGTEQYKQRVTWIQALVVCQVCGEERELDHPHHVEQGSKKDDRIMINVCIYCHRLIHGAGYSAVAKSREECLVIGWENNSMCEEMEKQDEN